MPHLLQAILFISGIILFFVGLDVARKQRFNALHFLVFLAIGGGLILFTLFPKALDEVGRVFGIPRGADILVYASIIFLVYFVLLLLAKAEKNHEDITALIRAIALSQAPELQPTGDVVLVIPAYNEEQVIQTTLKTAVAGGFSTIVLVNDGSKDATKIRAQEYAHNIPGIVILNHLKNRGQGAAIETGLEYLRRSQASFRYVATYDADGQHDTKDLAKMQTYLDTHVSTQVALGSRFLKDAQTNISWKRKLLLKAAILFTYFVSRIRLTDAHNGLRMFRREVLPQVRITQDGMAHASEIVDIIGEKKIAYAEVPVNIVYTEYSLAKGQKGSNFINIGFKTIWHKWFR